MTAGASAVGLCDFRESALDDYHSRNTQRLDLDSVVEMLDKLPAFQGLVRSFR